jgi:DNA-binding IscR family transcriptional regulator
VLDPALEAAQKAMEAELAKTTIADLLKKLP